MVTCACEDEAGPHAGVAAPGGPQGHSSQGLCLPFLQGHPLGLWDPSSLEVLGRP